jgi:uncharacterized protein YdhG (YjbR/CyaY superfamily)
MTIQPIIGFFFFVSDIYNIFMQKPKTISEYIQAAAPEAQPKLLEILECLRKAAPGAKEDLKWRQPALSYDWILFQFAAFKDHINLYPTPSVVAAFKDKLGGLNATLSAIQFPLDKPLPLDLIYEMAVFRVKESKVKGIKWM